MHVLWNTSALKREGNLGICDNMKLADTMLTSWTEKDEYYMVSPIYGILKKKKEVKLVETQRCSALLIIREVQIKTAMNVN